MDVGSSQGPGDPSPLAPHVGRDHGDIVGRSVEISAIRQQIEAARRGRLAAVSLEGEPGIGKSRLLLVAAQIVAEHGFVTVSVTADEELRGPFLLARAILRNREAHEASGHAADDLRRAADAVFGNDDPALSGLSPDERLLRVFDLAAVAIQSLTTTAPLALLLDDLQWSDDDSVRMLRYVVRAVGDAPLFIAIAARPEEMATTETAPLLADMERMGTLRRLTVSRMTQTESAELLRGALGGPVDATGAATMHAQSEGVPFILQELARTYRDAGLVQRIDDEWTLAKNAERLVPSAVRTLIERRAARLPSPTRSLLAEAAVIGRAFSVRDLLAMKGQLGEGGSDATAELAEVLRPAVEAGLVTELAAGSPADYRFAHEQVRHFVTGTLTAPRRRELHAAIVDLLTASTDVPEESLPLLARHALAAGDRDQAARFTIDAARAALGASAPEEALRMVDLALPVVSTPQERIALLTARDDALGMLRRPADRIEGLTELTALAEALGDDHLELETTLRRAASLRLAGDEDRALQLATEVREVAASRADGRAQLAACLEVGQGCLGKPLGESYTPPGREADLDGAEEAFTGACELARELDDVPALAAATRELGVIASGRVRSWFIDYERTHGVEAVLGRLVAGEALDDILGSMEVAPVFARSVDLLEQAVALFEQVGDQRGLMSSIIALAYIRFAPDIHLNASAQRLEEIRHLTTQLASLSRESERERAEAQMLYGVHVFARAKVVPDLAVSRGVEAHDKARILGERTLEFLAAGGVAMVHLELDDVDEAGLWVDRSAAAASADPTPFKARQLGVWRGRCSAAAGDAETMRSQFEQAIELAGQQRRAAALCDALAQFAAEAATLGQRSGDGDLLALAEQRAAEAKDLIAALPGRPLWGARADAALARVRLVRDDHAGAAEAGRSAVAALLDADLEDLNLDIWIPASRGILAGGSEEERSYAEQMLHIALMLVAQRIVDEDVRVRWFLGPVGRELTELTGSAGHDAAPRADGASVLAEDDVRLLRLLVEGRTNRQLAEALGLDDDALGRRLAEFNARVGVGSRAEAAAFAFRERVI